MKKLFITCALALGSLFAQAETLTFDTTNWADQFTAVDKDFKATYNGFTFELIKNTSSTALVVPDATSLKVYAGAQLVVTAPAGASMTNIEFTVASSGKANSNSDLTLSTGWSISGTVSFSANSTFSAVSAGLGNMTLTASKQLRTKKIVITYTLGEAPAVAAPKISCADNTVTITAEEGASIFYTTDNSEPTNASTAYTAPFAIEQTTTVKAIAYKGTDASVVTTFTAQYEGVYPGFEAFIANNSSGTIAGPISVLYQSADKKYLYLQDSLGGFMLAYSAAGNQPELLPGQTLSFISGKYSPYNSLPEMVPSEFGEVTDGTAPSPETVTIGSFSVDDSNKYIRLTDVSISDVNGKNFTIADAAGQTVAGYNTVALSEIPEGEGFTLTGFVCRFKDNLQVTPVSITGGSAMQQVATPTFSVAEGPVAEGTTVEILCDTPDAVIYYTLDGNVPNANSTEYTQAITLTEDVTIQAIAIKEEMLPSAIASATYSVVSADASEAIFDFAKPQDFNPAITAPTASSSGVDIDGTSYTCSAVTLAIAISDATSKPRLWMTTKNETEFRFYKNDSFTISVASGYILSEITFAGGTMTFNGDSGKIEEKVWKAADQKTQTVTFTAPSDAKTQSISSIKVIFAKAPTAIAEVKEAAPASTAVYDLQGRRVVRPAHGLFIQNGRKIIR